MKVAFILDGGPFTVPGTIGGEAHGIIETRWAEALGEGRYRLRNSPFYACGVSFRDVVAAAVLDKQLTVSRIILRGGHSTYRLVANSASEDVLSRWTAIEALGCTYESVERLFVIDVPPEADIHAAYRALQQGEDEGVWFFEEAHCGHTV